MHRFGCNWFLVWSSKLFLWAQRTAIKSTGKVQSGQPGSYIVPAVPKSYHKSINEINKAKEKPLKAEMVYLIKLTDIWEVHGQTFPCFVLCILSKPSPYAYFSYLIKIILIDRAFQTYRYHIITCRREHLSNAPFFSNNGAYPQILGPIIIVGMWKCTQLRIVSWPLQAVGYIYVQN